MPRGLSLVELVIATALFALVAVIGVQTLGAILASRDALAPRSAQVADLARASALLRADLGAAVPATDRPEAGGLPGSAIAGIDGGYAITTAGQPMIGSDAPLHRVVWRVADGTLTRQAWPGLRTGGLSPPPAMPVMDGVNALSLRSRWPVTGWIDGAGPPGAGPRTYTDSLPQAVELTLVTETHGAIPLIEALQ